MISTTTNRTSASPNRDEGSSVIATAVGGLVAAAAPVPTGGRLAEISSAIENSSIAAGRARTRTDIGGGGSGSTLASQPEPCLVSPVARPTGGGFTSVASVGGGGKRKTCGVSISSGSGGSSKQGSKRRMAALIDVLERCRGRPQEGTAFADMTMTTPRTGSAFTTVDTDIAEQGRRLAYVSAATSSPASTSSSASYMDLLSPDYSTIECVPTSFKSTDDDDGKTNASPAPCLPVSFVSPVFAPRRHQRKKMLPPAMTMKTTKGSGSSNGGSKNNKNDHLLLDRFLPPVPPVPTCTAARGGGDIFGVGGNGGGIGCPSTTITTPVTTLATDGDDKNLAAKHAFGRRWLYECIREPIETTASTTGHASSAGTGGEMSIFVGDDKENIDPAAARKKRRVSNPRTSKSTKSTSVTASNASPSSNGATVSLASATHRLCLRCRHCRDAADVLRPRSLSEYNFYSKIVRWSSSHYESCPAVPPALRIRYEEAKAEVSRGRKQFWAESAQMIGLVNIVDEAGRVGHGVAFAPSEEDVHGAASGDEMAAEDKGMVGK